MLGLSRREDVIKSTPDDDVKNSIFAVLVMF